MQDLLRYEPLGLVDRSVLPDPGAEEDTVDYEIVLGRRQIASLLFVAIVLGVVFSAVSYLAGRRAAPKPTPPAAVALAPAVPAPPVIEATTSVLPAEPALPLAKRDNKPEPPMFVEPLPGAVYIQMGAVDKGMAMVFAAGLRKYGFDGFVAPGPNERIFLGTFARRYQQ